MIRHQYPSHQFGVTPKLRVMDGTGYSCRKRVIQKDWRTSVRSEGDQVKLTTYGNAA